MDTFSILTIAIALAMDAFSVCITAGMFSPRPTFGLYFRLSFHFGLFQFMMPVFGYFGGKYIEAYIKNFDHWIAAGLLLIIGIKMIKESFEGCEIPKKDPSRGATLILLAIATSIDALAVGLSLGVLNKPIILPSIIIGIVCSIFSILGITIGHKIKAFANKRASIIGGIMLIAIGLKILYEHKSHLL